MFWKRQPSEFDLNQDKALRQLNKCVATLSKNDQTFNQWIQAFDKWFRNHEARLKNLEAQIQTLNATITQMKARDEKFAQAIQTLGSLSTESEQTEKLNREVEN